MKRAKRWFWLFCMLFVASYFVPFVWVENWAISVDCLGYGVFTEAFQEGWTRPEEPVRQLLLVMAFLMTFVGSIMLGLCVLQSKRVRLVTYHILDKQALDNALLVILIIMIGVGLFEYHDNAQLYHSFGFFMWVIGALGMTISNRWIGAEPIKQKPRGLEEHLVQD